MVIASKLADLYDIEEFLLPNLDLTKANFESIYDFGKSSPSAYLYLKFYLIEKLDISAFPDIFHEQVGIFKNYIKSSRILTQEDKFYTIHIIVENKIREVVIKRSIKDLIEFHNLFPIRKWLGEESKDIFELFDDFYKYRALHRFFINRGEVFYSDSMTLINDNRLSVYYPDLVEKNILRRGREEDLIKILNYKSKNELIEVLNRKSLPGISMMNDLKNDSKSDIRKILAQMPILKDLHIEEYFYFLSDPYQKFKYWIELEELNFKIFCLYNGRIESSFISMDSIMKDLITFGFSEIAKKIGDVYFRSLDYYRKERNFTESWATEKIMIQLRKIKKT